MADDNPLQRAIRRQVSLERLKAGQGKAIETAIRRAATSVRQIIGGLEFDLTETTRRNQQRVLDQLEKELTKTLKAQEVAIAGELEKIAGLYAMFEADDLVEFIVGNVDLKPITARQAFNAARRIPLSFNGQSLDDFIGQLSGAEVPRIRNTVRLGFYQGQTNHQIVRAITGTKARNYRDGILATTKRNAETIVRTSVQHAASASRQAVWQNNSDIVAKYEWKSTLDGRTSTTCKSLDGQTFEIGKGPTPPAHPNCRSSTVAVLADKYQFLSKGRTRAAKGGPVSSETDYFDWLKGQGSEFQNETLGATRAKLFRDGGLSAERFRELQLDRNFRPITLEEMQKLEPKAFERADIQV